MSAKIFWQLFASALFIAYAVFQLNPPTTTPFNEFIQTRATSKQDEFKKVLGEAEARVKNFAREDVPAEKKSKTVYNALREIGAGKGESGQYLDLSEFFGDLTLVSERNVERRNDIVLQELLHESQGKLKLGLDLQGGIAFTLRVDPKNFEIKTAEGLTGDAKIKAEESAEREKAALEARIKDGLGRAIIVMESRINTYGVSEPQIRTVGSDSIEIQLPGQDIANDPDAINAIKKPAKLEFRMVHRYLFPDAGTPEGKRVWLKENPSDPNSAAVEYEVLYQRVEKKDGSMNEAALYIKKKADAAGNIVRAARADYAPAGSDTAYITSISFTSEGAKKFENLTGKIAELNNAQPSTAHNGRMAIVLDGKLVLAPGIQPDRATGIYRALGDGGASIGSNDQHAAADLANVLNNPLEFPLELQDSKQIGSTLADDAKAKSVNAVAWGVGLVVVFMVIYYLWAGVVSVIGLIVNVVLMLGVMAAFGTTITLPGIAALVLTTGMAVDANILIFERIREEVADGKNLKAALTAGYARATATILDAHITSLMTAIILIVMGHGAVKGFGVTLAIGIVTTVFTALITCRALQELCVNKGVFTKIFFIHFFPSNTNIQFLNFAKPAFIASWLIVAAGIGMLFYRGSNAFSKDFKGGEAVTVQVVQEKAEIDSGEIKQIAGSLGIHDVTSAYQKTVGGENTKTLRIETELSGNAGKAANYENAMKVFMAVREKHPGSFPAGELEKLVVGQDAIGGTISSDLQTKAIISVGCALLGIMVYVALRFEIGFGLGAVVSSLHDVLLTVGLYVIIGHQFSAAMIAAILMVVGYSINDTIVVFDRIREEMKRHPAMSLRDVIHLSINRTLSRTVLTALTVFLNAVALYVFGAGDVREYGIVFIFGVLTGTFSSIFIASPIFFWWHKGKRDSVERAEARVKYSWEAGSDKAPVQQQ